MASPTPNPSTPATTGSGISANVSGMLCYTPFIGIIFTIVFLLIEPQKKDRFVRFHAFQALFLWVAALVLWLILAAILPFALWPLLWLVRLAIIGGLIFLMVKAYNNEEFKVPVIGDIAAKQAGA